MTAGYLPGNRSERKLVVSQLGRVQLEFVQLSAKYDLWRIYTPEQGERRLLSSMVFVGLERAYQYLEHRGWRIIGRSEFMRRARELFWFVFGERASDMRSYKHELRKIQSRYSRNETRP